MTDHLLSTTHPSTHSPDPTIKSSGEFSPVDTRVRGHWRATEGPILVGPWYVGTFPL